MHNPLRGIVTSEHEDDGGYRKHRGRDIGTRDLNNLLMPVWVYGVGRPVYAAFSGHWKKIVRWSKPGNKSQWTWAPERTGNGGLIANPDGEGQGYNHVRILDKWSEGDWINEGELIGHLDLSGNMSAPHLHFETWANWRDPYSDFSPKILFDKYGVDTMDDPAGFILASPASSTTGGLTMSDVNKILAELGQVRAQIESGYKGLRSEHTDLEERMDKLETIVTGIARTTSTTSRTSAWVIDPDTGQQVEVYLSGVLQRIDGKLSALVEAAESTGEVDPERVRTLAPAVNRVAKD